MASVMQRRVAAAQATRDRFYGKPFKWGERDCGQLAKWHLRKIGCPFKPAARLPRYYSLLGAKKALAKLGHTNLIELMDANFERIPPAAALPGDVIAVPGEELGALSVYLGNGRVIGFHPDALGACVAQPVEYEAAWRVPVVSGSSPDSPP
ncbi:NlpC/P60 family protein [Hephaestia caeni]|uniref:NlpC/P60 family protein n=1 Tax=Hephaestia caeni TaxID=645617 RepID=A0A397NIY7_9SPHN|nr:NlpC/P60 family protein [Hephaestia caeni]RIA37470.1 NlpC/P60 family protein [Hephaestia caeni]